MLTQKGSRCFGDLVSRGQNIRFMEVCTRLQIPDLDSLILVMSHQRSLTSRDLRLRVVVSVSLLPISFRPSLLFCRVLDLLLSPSPRSLTLDSCCCVLLTFHIFPLPSFLAPVFPCCFFSGIPGEYFFCYVLLLFCCS